VRQIVAMTGASGAIYGKRLLETLKEKGVETYLVISHAAEQVIAQELRIPKKALEKLASHTYAIDDWTVPIISGSFKTHGMIVIPCSMKTLAGIAHGYSDNIILRSADVVLKEQRKLILVPRETPLTAIHLQNMLELAKQGVMVVPAMPAYYHQPEKIGDLVDFVVGKVLDLMGIDHSLYTRWHEG
jgi:4-hydroxy-3-polyprenylbenzoate decarboxylase